MFICFISLLILYPLYGQVVPTSDLTARIDALENLVKHQAAEISYQKWELNSQREEIRIEFQRQTQDSTNQRRELASQKQEIANLKRELASQMQESAKQRKELDIQKQEIIYQKQKLARQKRELSKQNHSLANQRKKVTTQTQELIKQKQDLQNTTKLLEETFGEYRYVIKMFQDQDRKQTQKITSLESVVNNKRNPKNVSSKMILDMVNTGEATNGRFMDNQTEDYVSLLIRRSIPDDQHDVESNVAFQVTLDQQKEVKHLGIGQKIVYDNVGLNVGGGYHEHLGVFIAPQAGLYIFSISILSCLEKTNDEVVVAIYKNGNVIAKSLAFGGGVFDQGSVTVVTPLAVGDEIWVGVIELENTCIRGYGYTSFMGCLVLQI